MFNAWHRTIGEWLRVKRLASLSSRYTPTFTDLKRRVRILVIDDDKNSFPIQELKKEGYAIDYWSKVAPGDLRKLEEGEFDIIILDIVGVATKLSVHDGLGLLEHLKEYNPAQVIVAFSGQSFSIDKSAFWKKADDTLQKPVDALKSKEVIDHLILEKLTIENHLSSIRQLLLSNGIQPNVVNKIEKNILASIQGKSVTSSDKISKILSQYGDFAQRIIGIVDSAIRIYANVRNN